MVPRSRPQPRLPGYWGDSRSTRYSLLFAFPLLVLYETLAGMLGQERLAGVRNGADVLLKSLFLAFGGRHGLLVFGILLVGGGAVLVWRDGRGKGPLRPRVFGAMLAEASMYGLFLGGVAGLLTGLLLQGPRGLLAIQRGGTLAQFDLPTQLMISLGAGIYEELLFRVVLVGGLALAARAVLGWSPRRAGITAAILGALIFSGFHYVGPYGDPLELASFTFRAVAGLLFSGLYLLRGFGITAWSHALYDVFLSLRL